MQIWYIIIGAVLGVVLAPYGGKLFGLLTGAAAGVALARLAQLTRDNTQLVERLERLEKLRLADQVNAPAAGTAAGATAAATPDPARTEQADTTEPQQDAVITDALPTSSVTGDSAAARMRHDAASRPASPDSKASDMTANPGWGAGDSTPPPPRPRPRKREPRPAPVAAAPSLAQRAVDTGLRWITTGNVPVKIGVIVSFFGVAFLLKYAVDRIDVVVPLEVRYLMIAIVSAGVFGLGWKLRKTMRTYALSLQGGGIGALYLTIFAAFRLHPLLPASLAFPLLVLLTGAIGWLAVSQNALAFAILGTVGGFLAPVLISTGSGNHALLFGYYLLLNAAILGIAWSRSWRALNLMGFVFTFGIASLWGGQYYRPEYFASTEPFLVAFFLFYHAIAILYAFRQPPNLRGVVDATLIFGTPAIAFALQSALLADSEYGLAITAVVLGVLYAATAVWLRGLKQPQMRLLIESYISLAVAFVTLAVPLALDDRWTAVAWALEGAALVWMGVRQSRLLSKLSGTVLLLASGVAFIEAGWSSASGPAVLNGSVISGVLISLLSLMSAYRLERDDKPSRGQAAAVIALFTWGSAWWLGTVFAELDTRLSGNAVLHATTAFVALSALAATLIGARLRWELAQLATLLLLPAMVFFSLVYLAKFAHVLVGAGALSWLLLVAAHFVALKLAEARLPTATKLFGILHFSGALLLAGILAHEAGWRLDAATGSDVWVLTGALSVLMLAGFGLVRGAHFASWPLQRHEDAYAGVATTLVAVSLLFLAAAGMGDPGNPAPLPYLPILNPFDLMTAAGLALAFAGARSGGLLSRWLDDPKLHLARRAWLAVAFVLTTIAVVRAVHHLGGVPWNERTLVQSTGVQSTLTIYWAVLGISGMIAGVRRASRETWAIGAGLMLLVVVKLLLIDMGGTGTLARVISFLGVGGMLLVVGYFAPAPPKTEAAKPEPQAA